MLIEDSAKPMLITIEAPPLSIAETEKQQTSNEHEKCSSNAIIEDKINLNNDDKKRIIQQDKDNDNESSSTAMTPANIALIELLKRLILLNNEPPINQLVDVILQFLQLPTSHSLVEPLTNALRVSCSQPALMFNFISMLIGSPIDNTILDKKGQNNHINSSMFRTISRTPTTAIKRTKQELEDKTIAVSILERINRMQAELWITYPLSKKGISSLMSPTCSTDTSKRSSFTTTSSDNSTVISSDDAWFSSHHSSMTTVTTTTSSSTSKFNFSALMDNLHEQRLSPFDATLDDVMKFQSDFDSIKSTIQSFLTMNPQSNNSQINQALESLVKNGNCLNDGLKEFKCGYIFVQLCKVVMLYTKGTKAFFEKVADKVVMTEQDIYELEKRAGKGAHMVDCISRTFQGSLIAQKEYHNELKPIYKTRLNVITTVVCDQMFSQSKQIYSVWIRVNDIKTSIIKGIATLAQLDLSDTHLTKKYAQSLDTLRDIRESIFTVVYHDLQLLVNDVISSTTTSGNPLTSYEKIKNNLIITVFDHLQHFKNDLLGSTIILEKYSNKKKLKLDIENSKLWLKVFKTNLIDFAVSECCQWNPITNPTIQKESLLGYQVQYDRFILNQYDTICEYFPRYSGSVISQCYAKSKVTFHACNKAHGLNYQQLGNDAHLVEEFQWFQAFQGECDEVSDILKLISRILQQQGIILNFIQHIDKFKTTLLCGGGGDDIVKQQEEASRIYKDEFHAIQWPTALNYYGQSILGNKFYFYSQSLYIQVSKIKTDFMTVCQDAFFLKRA